MIKMISMVLLLIMDNLSLKSLVNLKQHTFEVKNDTTMLSTACYINF